MDSPEETLPHFLFHYTSVDTLALILSNRTIRFTSLDKLDDMQESDTLDDTNICSCCYVSCWTDDAAESIPMWNMYASEEAGVRIKLPLHPFQTCLVHDEHQSGYAWKNPEETRSEGYLSFDLSYIGPARLVRKIHYTDDDTLLRPKAFTKLENEATDTGTIFETEHARMKLDAETIGTQKSTAWAFQHEWRYLFYAFKYATLEEALTSNELKRRYGDKQNGAYFIPPFQYYDLRLDDRAFRQMEILMSPKILPGYKVIVRELVRRYNPAARIIESSLRLR